MKIVDEVKKLYKGKGRVNNLSTETLWIIESTTNHPIGPSVAHKLAPGYKTPLHIDADGIKRIDGKPIKGHSAWWKIYNFSEADVKGAGDRLKIDVSIMEAVSDDHFDIRDKNGDIIKETEYYHSDGWGIPIINIIDAKKDHKGVLCGFLLEGYGWISKSEAIKMTQEGKIHNTVYVNPKNHAPYLRSRPDKSKSNNFKNMAKS
jgi:rRNA processing protein Gar1